MKNGLVVSALIQTVCQEALSHRLSKDLNALLFRWHLAPRVEPPTAEDGAIYTKFLEATPLGEHLHWVALAASGCLDCKNLDQYEAVSEAVVQALPIFAEVAESKNGYQVPDSFWSTPIGEIFALAKIWLDGDELITIAEAASIMGISVQTMAARVRNGKVPSVRNPNATNPHRGAKLVARSALKAKGKWR